jgi:pimeloyl-ACP methyl ester carboxylesterase
VTPVQTVAARTTSPIDIARQDQARARQPDDKGEVIRDDGVRIFYERYGAGDPAIVFVPSWSIVHSRIWKAQIPYFSRRHRVVTMDPRGNGRSDRPATATAYAEEEMARDILAVMDAAGVERAVLVSLSRGAQRALIASSLAGERIVGHVFVSPSTWIGEGLGERGVDFERDDAPDIGWARSLQSAPGCASGISTMSGSMPTRTLWGWPLAPWSSRASRSCRAVCTTAVR